VRHGCGLCQLSQLRPHEVATGHVLRYQQLLNRAGGRAGAAQALDRDGDAAHIEAHSDRGGHGGLCVDVGPQVLDRPAPRAHHVVMLIEDRVVDSRSPARGDASHRAELLQDLEGRVDGRQSDAGKLVRDRLQHFLGRNVATQPPQGLIDDEPLRRHALAALAETPYQPGFWLLHAANYIISQN
jgi:hypothetical protein